MDEPIKHGLENGLALLDMLVLGRESRTSSTFSCRTILAGRLLMAIENQKRNGLDMSELLEHVSVMRAKLATIIECGVAEPEALSRLLSYFRALTYKLTIAGARPMGCW